MMRFKDVSFVFIIKAACENRTYLKVGDYFELKWILDCCLQYLSWIIERWLRLLLNRFLFLFIRLLFTMTHFNFFFVFVFFGILKYPQASIKIEVHLMDRRFSWDKIEIILQNDRSEMVLHHKSYLFAERRQQQALPDVQKFSDVVEEEWVCEEAERVIGHILHFMTNLKLYQNYFITKQLPLFISNSHNVPSYCIWSKMRYQFQMVLQLHSILFYSMETQRQMLESYRSDSFLYSSYELMELLGSGCFGKIFKAINKQTTTVVALKVQLYKKTNFKLSINNQIKILQLLKGKEGVPATYQSGNWSRGAFMELQILHQSLKQNRVYSAAQIIDFTLELINILETIHNCNVIHNDLKPQNLMRSKNGKLYLIDYGLARILPKKRIGSHRVGGFMGTPRYASIQAHKSLQQSKKDDLQSAFYNIAYLYYHHLPWSKLKVPVELRLQKIRLLKIKHKKTLFNQMPSQFQTAFEYICSLQDYAQPNYNYLKRLFKRHRSLEILYPSQQQQEYSQRSKVKKVSLNMSNFLHVPEVKYLHLKHSNKDEIIQKEQDCKDQQQMSHKYSLDSSRTFNNYSRNSQRSITDFCEAESGDFGQQQNIQPQLPKSLNFGKNIVMKNPFKM